MTPIPVPGATPQNRAIALTGALAEAAVTQLALASAQGWVPLSVRHTDLPSLILEAASRPDAELLALERPIRVLLTTDALLVFTTDPHLADALLRAQSADAPHD
ncbi:MAG: hypothetical protein AB7G17_06630 [Phycisphaerales bacterium]